MCVTHVATSQTKRCCGSPNFFLGSRSGKGAEGKRFSRGRVTFISISAVCSEAECLASWWALVQKFWARGKGAGDRRRGRKACFFQSLWWGAKETKWSWTDCHAVTLQENEKGSGDVLTCFPSCWKKKWQRAVRIQSPFLADGKTNIGEKAPSFWRPFEYQCNGQGQTSHRHLRAK